MYKMIFKQRFLQRNRNKIGMLLDCIFVLLQIALLFFLYKAVFDNNEFINSNSLEQVMTYIVIAIVIDEISYVNGTKLGHLVNCGKMQYELLKPYTFPVKAIVEAAADFCAGIIWKCTPIIILAYFTMGLDKPASLINGIVFVGSSILGVFVLWGIQMTLQMFGFWFKNMLNIFMMMSAVYKILGGMFIPYCFLPKALGQVLMFTPFAYIWHVPMEIYFGRLSLAESLIGLFMQVVWIVIFVMLVKLLYKHGKKSLQVSNQEVLR